MRKKGSYRKNKLFCLLAAAALRFVQSYLNDIVSILYTMFSPFSMSKLNRRTLNIFQALFF